MGKRINLAALASEEITDDEPRTPRPAPIVAVPEPNTDPAGGITELAVDEIATNPLNERDERDEDADELAELASTIAQHGVLQPLVVVSVSDFVREFPDQQSTLSGRRWVSLIGNRRLTAARIAGAERVPTIVDSTRLPSMYEVMLVENSHRKDLAPLHEAQAIQQVLTREQMSQRDLGKRIGRAHTYIQQRLALLNLVPALREALAGGTLTVKEARQLGTLSEDEQNAIADAGPPYRPQPTGNPVATRARRPYIPTGNPAAAAASIRTIYSGDELAELVRLLTEPDPA